MIEERETQKAPPQPRRPRLRIIFAVLAILLVAASATMIPRFVRASNPKKPSRNLTTPFTKPSTSPSANSSPHPSSPPVVDTTGWIARGAVQDGFFLRMPASWKGGWFEGTWDFEPKGLPSLAEDGNTFAVDLTVVSGEYDRIAPKSAKPFISDAASAALVWMAKPRLETFAIAWDGCPGFVGDCGGGAASRTLLVHISASTQALWHKHITIGRAIVGTIETYNGDNPIHGRAPQYEGGADFPDDPVDTALVRFLDARAEGIGADEQYCCDATALYSKDGLYYRNGAPLISWEFWRVAGIIGADYGRFRVVVHYKGGASRTEMISIGFQKGEAWPQYVPSVLAACSSCS